MTTKNTEKTAVLSLRIPAALKTKLEAQAAQKNMSLSDYVRDRLTASDGEKILQAARRDLSALELGAEKVRRQLETDAHQYNRTINEMCTELRLFADQHKHAVRIQQQMQEQQLEHVNDKYRECASAFDNASRRYSRDNWALFWGDVAAIAVAAVLAAVMVVFVLDMSGFLQKPPQ
ncbi:TPA: hypothetical protein U0A13_004975 [Escherichia coli]|nr:hypothetical protein [Escherichia coli]HEL8012959.1 hypothetical protein [Escherichia coli]HEM0101808.1 hypothetical protein [Escherichia coli]HEM0849382.1 hypothetical protein [Escherichia coli]